MKIVLASGSPRRAKILKDLGVDFEVVKTDAPEVSASTASRAISRRRRSFCASSQAKFTQSLQESRSMAK